MLKRPSQPSLYTIVVGFLSFTTLALPQEPSYSADSLMAAFKKGSTTAVKGTEITLSGVGAEIKKSSLIFKSADNEQVTCELISPLLGMAWRWLVNH